MRGSFDHLNDQTAAHVLSAFASDAALILAHYEVAAAPDEVPAVPVLIEELGLTGVLFTADALHCQKGGSREPLQPVTPCWSASSATSQRLHDALAALCDEQRPIDQHATVDRRRHGRQEHRLTDVFEVAGRLSPEWQPVIACMARISRLTWTKDTRSGLWKAHEEVAYYACVTKPARDAVHAMISGENGECFNHSNAARSLGFCNLSRSRTITPAKFASTPPLSRTPCGSIGGSRTAIITYATASSARMTAASASRAAFARLRSLALNILRANGIGNVRQALYTKSLTIHQFSARTG